MLRASISSCSNSVEGPNLGQFHSKSLPRLISSNAVWARWRHHTGSMPARRDLEAFSQTPVDAQ